FSCAASINKVKLERMKIGEPVVLDGRFVRLEPLTMGHVPALAEVGLDPELWRWTTGHLATAEDMRKYVETALEAQARGTVVPFATVEKASRRVVGSTRFGNIEARDRRVEIGWTWVARPWQRTVVNTEAKYMMLRHAFEAWGCLRVELKTDVLNVRSREAIERIGAKQEGIFRKHMIAETGRVRDTVYFSIIDSEWPGVKRRLEKRVIRLARNFPPQQQRQFSGVIVPPHGGFPARHFGGFRDVIPAVGTMIDRVEDQSLVPRIGAEIRFVEQGVRDCEAGLIV